MSSNSNLSLLVGLRCFSGRGGSRYSCTVVAAALGPSGEMWLYLVSEEGYSFKRGFEDVTFQGVGDIQARLRNFDHSAK
jgi:hypothetical protein